MFVCLFVFLEKKVDFFYTSVGMGNESKWLHTEFYILVWLIFGEMWLFLAFFKSRMIHRTIANGTDKDDAVHQIPHKM